MVDQNKIKKIANSIDKLIYDFIPELEGPRISENDKIKIVEDTLSDLAHNDPTKSKLFVALPQTFIADFVCKNKNEIKDRLQ
ncbi:MAG: hypothetical protein HeimC2_33560 [Candidatus Heimdallarchaeota archaeon LC_2]|nr:MAG: hypothetical protein HeimC2_33560 [Candidatus Heimdallarchaeota archaeon LC_2]